MIKIKLITTLIFLISLSGFVISCDDSGNETEWFTDFAVGSSVTKNISANGNHFYRVNIETAGNYTFSLTSLGSDFAESVVVGNDGDKTFGDVFYYQNVHQNWYINNHVDTTENEESILTLNPGYHYIAVEELDNIPSHYTLTVTAN
ncbi:MAG: hypothetical protein JW982_07175 [Spirochaetes bacterium]|nr:hypothetical protein [Spirochaetota bacterium]